MVHNQRKNQGWGEASLPRSNAPRKGTEHPFSDTTTMSTGRALLLVVFVLFFGWKNIHGSFVEFVFHRKELQGTPVELGDAMLGSWNMEKPFIDKSCYHSRPFNVSKFLSDSNSKTLPKPWIHIGMPKTGTTTLEMFWKCGLNQEPLNDFVSHSTCKVTSKELRMKAFGGRGLPKNPAVRCPSSRVHPCQLCGKCMGKASNLSLPLLSSCGNYQAWAQLDSEQVCYYPQWDYLDQISAEAPDATLVFMFRDVDKWANSVLNFQKGMMIKRMGRCRPLNWQGRNHLKEWFCSIVNYSRRFAAEHPSHTYIEINLDDPASGGIASKAFGIDESCWGTHNVNTLIHQNETIQQ